MLDWGVKPSWASSASARAWAASSSERSRRARSMSGSKIFSRAVITGIRLKAWNTKPIISLRKSARACSDSLDTSRLAMTTLPSLAVSSMPATFRRLVLPLPQGPHTETISPRPTCSSMSRSACTPRIGPPYTFCTRARLTSGADGHTNAGIASSTFSSDRNTPSMELPSPASVKQLPVDTVSGRHPLRFLRRQTIRRRYASRTCCGRWKSRL